MLQVGFVNYCALYLSALMMSIEDVIIKTLISVELPVATACKMFMPYRGNCFGLLSFRIISAVVLCLMVITDYLLLFVFIN
jgi:hypothetical protein